jgi:predicted metal-dependent enzyme (double-stranded beta helix superfamily)
VNPDKVSTSPQAWPWPDSLDALVAAPDFHHLLFENERVRVLDVRIGPGQRVPIHTHRWASVLTTLSSGQFIRRDAEGKVLTDTRQMPPPAPAPATVWSGPMSPHSVENVGETELRVISVELKDGFS